MKRRYNTLNEEMNRMKSLFGESRLYGNLVDKQEDSNNLITEGFKVFDNLADAFRLAGKGFDNIQLTKFLNYEINAIGDMVSHVSGFKSIWDILAPEQNWAKTAQVLKKIEGDLPKIPDLEESRYVSYYKNHMDAIPQEGGLRDIAKQMLTEARYGGKQSTDVAVVPVYKEIATTVDGAAVVGTKSDGGLVVYKDVNDKIIPSNKIKVEKNSDTLIDAEGKVIATQDEFGNWVNAKGERIDKPEGSKVNTEPEEAVIVPDNVKPNGSKSTEEVDAILVKEMGKGDGVVITDKEVSGEELIRNQKELVEAQTELARIKLELSRAETDKMRIELDGKRVDAEKEVKLKQEESQQIRDKNQNTSSEKKYVSTDEKGLGDIKTKDEDKLSGELGISKESGWWRKNISPLYDWLYVLRRNEGDSKLIKNAKFFGSSLVDPIGIFRRFLPGEAAEKVMNKGGMRVVRAAGGITTNLLTYNMLLYNLPMIFTDDCEWCDKFSLSNVWATRWEYYKNWSPASILFKGWAKNEKISFCKKLYKETGICCDKEMQDKNNNCLTYDQDFTKNMGIYLEEAFKGYKCEDFQKIMPNNSLGAEERKKVAKEIATNYNENMLGKLGVGFTFDIAKAIGILNIELANIGDELLLEAKDDQGNNLLEYYLHQQKSKACITNLKPNEVKENEGTIYYVDDEIE